MKSTSTRNSSFEILRLLAMVMVILGHCVLSTAQDTEPILGKLDLVGWGVKAFTVCAVNLFFLLSGYFLSSANFKLSRVLEIWLKTIFYSIALYLLISTFSNTFNLKECITYLSPVFSKKYWYIQTYIAMALIMPFIAKGLEALTNRQLTFLIAVLIVFFSVHQTFIKVAYTLDQTQGYGFVWGCVTLVIGFWLRKNSETIYKISEWLFLAGYFILSVMIFISNYLIVKLDIAGGVTSRGNFYAYNSVTVLLQSFCLFCFFVVLSKRQLRVTWVNYFSKNALAGYLISSHPLLLYPLWQQYINMQKYTSNIGGYIIVSFIFSVLILIACILIDKVLDTVLKALNFDNIKTNIDTAYLKYMRGDRKENV